jgi:hypothetical protein
MMIHPASTCQLAVQEHAIFGGDVYSLGSGGPGREIADLFTQERKPMRSHRLPAKHHDD